MGVFFVLPIRAFLFCSLCSIPLVLLVFSWRRSRSCNVHGLIVIVIFEACDGIRVVCRRVGMILYFLRGLQYRAKE